MRMTIKGLVDLTAKDGRTQAEARLAYNQILSHFDRGLKSLAARVADSFLRCYGVEMLETKRGRYLYANTGDTYAPTVIVPIYGRRTRPFIASWGDVVEAEGTEDSWC